MKRFDLRHLKNDFAGRLKVIDFDNVQKSADIVDECGYILMNSLRFNEVDWTIVVKKAS